MSTSIEHYLAAERALRHVEHMFPDDPSAIAGLAKGQMHATLAVAGALQLLIAARLDAAGFRADVMTHPDTDADRFGSNLDAVQGVQIDPAEQHL